MDRIEYLYTFGMREDDVREYLEEHDVGVLSLANDGEAYAIPVGYVYDDGSVHVRLGDHPDSKKMAFLEETTEACFLLYDVDGNESWSIVATGSLDRADEAIADAFDEATINEEFERLRIFDEDVEAVALELYTLEVDTLTGRKTSE